MGSGVFLLHSVDYSFCSFCKNPHFGSFIHTFFQNLSDAGATFATVWIRACYVSRLGSVEMYQLI